VRSKIEVLNASALRNEDLRGAAQRIAEVFLASVSIEALELNLAGAYDRGRRQSNSTVLLAQVLAIGHHSGALKRIALVDVDLFVPVLTFVFGEAQLGGRAAIVSARRLANQFYGLPRNDALMFARLEKELIHELGHTFGLYHCHQFECVMRSSTYVEEIDLKRAYPCDACAEQLQKPRIPRILPDAIQR
jgi:archaemetzincin